MSIGSLCLFYSIFDTISVAFEPSYIGWGANVGYLTVKVSAVGVPAPAKVSTYK